MRASELRGAIWGGLISTVIAVIFIALSNGFGVAIGTLLMIIAMRHLTTSRRMVRSKYLLWLADVAIEKAIAAAARVISERDIQCVEVRSNVKDRLDDPELIQLYVHVGRQPVRVVLIHQSVLRYREVEPIMTIGNRLSGRWGVPIIIGTGLEGLRE